MKAPVYPRASRIGVALALVLTISGHISSTSREAGTRFPEVRVALEPVAASDCPSGWVCLWQHADFEGAMVMLHDCCAWENLADVGFNNMMSSWRNRKAVDAKVAELANGDGARLCLRSSSSDSWVGSAWNDSASSAKVFASDGAC
jgi:hypothetical protein